MKEKKAREVLKGMVKAGLFIGVTLWILKFLMGDTYGSILRQIVRTSKTGVLVLTLLEMVFIIMDSVTITLIIKRYRSGYSYREGLKVLLYGNFYKGITFGNGTKVAQLYLLNKQEVPIGVSSGMLTMQYTFHRLAIMVNATVMMFCFNVFKLFDFATYKPYFIVGYGVNFFVIVIMVLLCTWQNFHQVILIGVEKVLVWIKKEGSLKAVKLYFKDLEQESRFLLEKPGWCAWMIFVNAMKLMCWYVMPYIIYKSVTGEVPGAHLVEIMTLTAMMHLLLGVIPAPVGMGSTEVIYLLLFTSLFGKVTASTTMIIYRLFTYYLPFLMSILFMIGYSYRQGKKQAEKKAHTIEEYMG